MTAGVSSVGTGFCGLNFGCSRDKMAATLRRKIVIDFNFYMDAGSAREQLGHPVTRTCFCPLDSLDDMSTRTCSFLDFLLCLGGFGRFWLVGADVAEYSSVLSWCVARFRTGVFRASVCGSLAQGTHGNSMTGE